MVELRPFGLSAGRAGFTKSFANPKRAEDFNCELPVTYPGKILPMEAGPLDWSKPRGA